MPQPSLMMASLTPNLLKDDLAISITADELAPFSLARHKLTVTVQKEAVEAMAISFPSGQTFLTGNPLLLPIRRSNSNKPLHLFLFPYRTSASMNKEGSNFQSSRDDKFSIAKMAVVAVAAGVLVLGAVGDAEAAKSGGRVGGKAFRPPSPRPSGPRINNNSRTNIFINPPVAPPLVGGYGYGSPFYGGWGYSPFSFFVPGPSIAVGIGGGFEFFAAILVLGAISTVIRRFTRQRKEEDDDF